MIRELSVRQLNFLGFAACLGMLLYAVFTQYAFGLEPCPLCIFQRVGIFALGIGFLLAGLVNPSGTPGRLFACLLILPGAAGAIGVAGRHVWLQNLPPDQVPACGPGLNFMLDTFPLQDVLSKVLSGSGECAEIDWSFLGLSMPAWVLICAAVLAVFGLWNNLRRVS